jgi:hypothetical protein
MSVIGVWHRHCAEKSSEPTKGLVACGGHRTTLLPRPLVPELQTVLGTIPLPLLRSSCLRV